MKHDVSFVTCVYDDLVNTQFNGRLNRGTHYVFSLAHMHQMGAPIYCYSDKINMYRAFPAFLKYGYENFRFINYNLEDSPYLAEIQRIKQKDVFYVEAASWRTRCIEIMWGKFDWIIHTAEKMGLDSGKYLYWVDAGLSHPGILPKKFNTFDESTAVTSSHKYDNSFNFDLIFNEDLPDFLVEYAGEDNLLHFMCTQRQHSDKSHLPRSGPKGTDPKNGTHVGTVVGGLFGGPVRLLHDWALDAKDVCADLLQHDFLLKEEDVLTYMLNTGGVEDPRFKDNITIYKFDTWYHEDWDGYVPKLKSFSAFFEEFAEYRKTK